MLHPLNVPMIIERVGVFLITWTQVSALSRNLRECCPILNALRCIRGSQDVLNDYVLHTRSLVAHPGATPLGPPGAAAQQSDNRAGRHSSGPSFGYSADCQILCQVVR